MNGGYTLWDVPKKKIMIDGGDMDTVVAKIESLDREYVGRAVALMWLPPEDEDGRVTGLGDIKYGVQVLDLVDSIRINGGE